MSSRLAGPVKHFEIIRILFCQNTRNVCIFQVSSLDFNTTLTILDTGANLGMLCGPGGGLGRGELPASRLAEKMKMFETHQVGNESPLTHTEQQRITISPSLATKSCRFWLATSFFARSKLKDKAG